VCVCVCVCVCVMWLQTGPSVVDVDDARSDSSSVCSESSSRSDAAVRRLTVSLSLVSFFLATFFHSPPVKVIFGYAHSVIPAKPFFVQILSNTWVLCSVSKDNVTYSNKNNDKRHVRSLLCSPWMFYLHFIPLLFCYCERLAVDNLCCQSFYWTNIRCLFWQNQKWIHCESRLTVT